MKSTRGFTVVELLIVVTVLTVGSVLFFMQKSQIETVARDEQRKTAINAMYYSLEEVYHKANKSYPRTVSTDTLPSVDPALFKDTAGVTIGDSDAEYHYDPTNCDGDVCKSYTLRAPLENEADYTKTSRNK